MINSELAQRIKENSDIVAIIGESVSLRKRGVSYMGLCPFHSEKTPSFSVNPSKGLFHCFGCGKGGDVFTFVQEHNGMSFPEAVRYLAGKLGISCDDFCLTPQEQEKYAKRESMKVALAYAAREFAKNLSLQSVMYWNIRNFDRETQSKFANKYYLRLPYLVPQEKARLSIISRVGLFFQYMTCMVMLSPSQDVSPMKEENNRSTSTRERLNYFRKARYCMD